MPDYIFMLESRLSPGQLQVLARIQQEAQDLSLNIYLVGGAVRDLMTGSAIRDLDFVVEGNAMKLARRLKNPNSPRVRGGTSQPTVEMSLANGVRLSVGMARNEFYEGPGNVAQIAPAPILEDLRRRDFSVNSMGVSLTPGSRGLLLDPTNGLADVESRELRVLHNYSFVHDPVRLFRLVRFSIRLGFRADLRTQELFDSALERGYQKYIHPTSLGQEVEQVAREENIVQVLKGLAEKGLLEALHPALQKKKPDYDGLSKFQKYRHQAEAAGYQLDPFVPALHYLAKRLKGTAERQLLRNLNLDKQTIKQVLGIQKDARRLVNLLGRRRKIGPREIYRMLTPVPIGLLVFVLAEFSGKKKVQSKIYNYLFKYRPMRDKLPVRELQLMGMSPGPKFDQVLEKYFEAQLDGKLRGRTQQLRFLRKLAGLPKVAPQARTHKGKSGESGAPQVAVEAEASGAQESPAALKDLSAKSRPKKQMQRGLRKQGKKPASKGKSGKSPRARRKKVKRQSHRRSRR